MFERFKIARIFGPALKAAGSFKGLKLWREWSLYYAGVMVKAASLCGWSPEEASDDPVWQALTAVYWHHRGAARPVSDTGKREIKIGRCAGKSHEGATAPHPAPGQAGRPWRAGRRRGEPAEGVADAPGAALPGSLWRSGAPWPPGRPGGIGVVSDVLSWLLLWTLGDRERCA